MDFFEAVEKRRTIRDFENVSIEEEVIERMIDAGMKAPSNDHMRDWHFIVIRDKNILLKLLNPIPEKVSAEEVNAILRDWDLNDTCQQKVYIDAIPKQYQMLMNASCVIVPVFRQKNRHHASGESFTPERIRFHLVLYRKHVSRRHGRRLCLYTSYSFGSRRHPDKTNPELPGRLPDAVLYRSRETER